MSVNVVRLPFRSRGKQYNSGDIITSPENISLFATKLKDGKIVSVDERNIDTVALYLERRRGVKNAKETLQAHLSKTPVKPVKPAGPVKPVKDKYNDPAYIGKVMRLADKHGVDVTGKSVKEIVEILKTKK